MSSKLLIAVLCATLSMFTATSAVASSQRCDEKGEEHQHGCEHAATIYVGASAQGSVFHLLRQDFNIVSLRDGMPSPFFFGPVVVGAADLADPSVAKLLLEVYAAGRTVALAGATLDEADRFSRFVGVGDTASCYTHNDGSRIALYGLQKSVARRPAVYSSYCLNLGKGGRRGDRSVRNWLLARFALSPPEPPRGAVQDDSSVDLQALSSQIFCHFEDTDDPDLLGRQMQLDSYINSIRSFDNDQDLYLVNNVLGFQLGSSVKSTYEFGIQRFGASGVQNIAASTDFVDPGPMSVTMSYTNSDSTTVSGSVGFNQTQGANASIGESVTAGESETVSLPAVIITNQTTVDPPFPKWTFTPTSASTNSFLAPQTDWVWTVNQSAYGADGGEGTTGRITIQSGLGMGDFAAQPKCSTIPYPFPEWTVSQPVITGFSANGSPATSVSVDGGVFTINGAQFYPGLVTNVFIAGIALPSANYVTQSDTAIQVTVPSGTPTGSQPVAVETTFNNQPLVSKSVNIDVLK
jgi:hypothetical protein